MSTIKYKKALNIVNEPYMEFEKPYEVLFDLSTGQMKTLRYVKEIIFNIEIVMAGVKDFYVFGGETGLCLVGVEKNETTITDYYENDEPIYKKISTDEIYVLMKDWLIFLEEYEKAKPGYIDLPKEELKIKARNYENDKPDTTFQNNTDETPM